MTSCYTQACPWLGTLVCLQACPFVWFYHISFLFTQLQYKLQNLGLHKVVVIIVHLAVFLWQAAIPLTASTKYTIVLFFFKTLMTLTDYWNSELWSFSINGRQDRHRQGTQDIDGHCAFAFQPKKNTNDSHNCTLSYMLWTNMTGKISLHMRHLQVCICGIAAIQNPINPSWHQNS